MRWDPLIDALHDFATATSRGDRELVLAEIRRQFRHLDTRCLQDPPQRFANSRGGLHGPTAVWRVVTSERLTTELLRLLTDQQIIQEIERRRRVREHRAHKRQARRSGFLMGVLDLVRRHLGGAA